MEESTLDIYEAYFKNDNWSFSLEQLTSHKCFFCNNSKYRMKFDYKQDAAQFIITYLNHLKIYGSKWKKVKYFIDSIRISNFCDETTDIWIMKYWYEKDIYIFFSLKK